MPANIIVVIFSDSPEKISAKFGVSTKYILDLKPPSDRDQRNPVQILFSHIPRLQNTWHFRRFISHENIIKI